MKITDFNLLDRSHSQDQFQQVIDEFNQTDADYPRHASVQEVFAAVCAKYPDREAITHGDRSLTYQDLDQYSDRIAAYLLKHKLVAGSPVGVLLRKSPETIGVLLGILKAGGAYVPLSEKLPLERLRMILIDTQAGFLISESKFIREVNHLQWECKDLGNYLIIDSEEVDELEETENELSRKDLWDFVGKRAYDDISQGGWSNSYTGEDLSREVMDEYGDNILKKLTPILQKEHKVLEVGCSSGITMFRLAPMVKQYVGTDLSPEILAKTEAERERLGQENISLYSLPADEIDQVEERGFDVVIINSVLQCFRGHNYLRKVLRKVIDMMAPQGKLFLGDLMDADLKKELIDSLVEFKEKNAGKGYTTKTDWSQELFVSRSLLEDLAFDFPEICEAQHSGKISEIPSELSLYRFDSILEVDKTGARSSLSHGRTRQKVRHGAGAFAQLELEEDISRTGEDLAYLMYTSGSTGRPRAVQIPHRGILRLVLNTNYFPFGPENRLMHIATLAFDASTFEIWGPLLHGGSLHIIDEADLLNTASFKSILSEKKINCGFVTTALFNTQIEVDASLYSSFHTLLVGGDRMSARHVNLARENCPSLKLSNIYGPTENTTYSTWYPIEEMKDGSVPIGKPIANTRCYILNKNMDPLPLGISGELWISGDGLALGYLNDEKETEAKFVPHPFRKGEKIYRTGDLAKWLPDGNIEFLGRIDKQIKIRGYRVEPGEIEHHLRKVFGIEDAIVVAREKEGGPKNLCGYYVSDTEFEASELKSILAEHLPEYAIPTWLVQMKQFPRNSNGKLDYRALPDPEMQATAEDEQAMGEVERQLAAIWNEVLPVDRIGSNDNFFNLGGDSIKAIQVISRCLDAGLTLDIGDIFEFPTIAQLAALVKVARRNENYVAVEGNAPLTAIQDWFFRDSGIPENHFNQSVCLKLKESLSTDLIQTALQALYSHHDALRTVFMPEVHSIVQHFPANETPFHFEEKDFREQENGVDSMNAHAQSLQESMDPENGPLLKAALYRLAEGDFLLLAVHHLVVDGVSWRILLEDFNRLCGQLKAEKDPDPIAIGLPAKSTSLKNWSEELVGYAASEALLEQKAWWQKQESLKHGSLLQMDGLPLLTRKESESLSFKLDKEETGKLLKESQRAYHTQINDLLLSALACAVSQMHGEANTLIMLEGHGRENILPHLDLSRTVGWFTSVYPVVLPTGLGSVGRDIKEVKETLRSIPANGVGYGLLKYLAPEEVRQGMQFSLKPEILFNYLGQFDGDFDTELFSRTKEAGGNPISDQTPMEYPLEVSGIVTGGELNISLTFNRIACSESIATELLSAYQTYLRELIVHCSEKTMPELTASDLTYKGLNNQSLEVFLDKYNIDPGQLSDIHELTPLQEGILFHTLFEDDSMAYFEQLELEIAGEFNEASLRKVWGILVDRHEILRTLFVNDDVESPLQVVLRDRETKFAYEDISALNEATQERFLEQFKEQDLAQPFDLSRDVLFRVRMYQVAPRRAKLFLTFHHILLDGWSVGILLNEFRGIYSALQTGAKLPAPNPFSYRDYVRWIGRQDKEKSGKFWEEYLAGMSRMTVIPGRKITLPEQKYQSEELYWQMPEEMSGKLDQLARGNGVTMHSVFEGIWSVILKRLNNSNDLLFGTIVSGRNPGVEGIDKMVGLFINALPVRVKFSSRTSFVRLIKQIHERATQAARHDFYPLSTIQSKTKVRQDLFDHLLVYENFYLDKTAEEASEKGVSIDLKKAQAREQINYDLGVVISPGKSFRFRFLYNANAFDESYVQRLQTLIETVIGQVLQNPYLAVGKFSLETGSEPVTGFALKGGLLPAKWAESREEWPRTEAARTFLGRQIDGLGAHPELLQVVDADQNLQPLGFPGEIVVAAQDQSVAVLRTGIRGMIDGEGELHLLGMLSDKIELHGVVIHPGDIESLLVQHSGVEGAYVSTRQEGEKNVLVAWLQGVDVPDVETVQSWLSHFLPRTMVPQFVVKVNQFQYGQHGELREDRLPDFRGSGGLAGEILSPVESILAEIWMEVLQVVPIGVEDNFFHLGGDSIKAMSISSKLRAKGLQIQLKDIFTHPNIASLAKVVQKESQPIPQSAVTGTFPLTPIQRWFFEQNLENPGEFVMGMALHSDSTLDMAQIRMAANSLSNHHDLLRTRFDSATNPPTPWILAENEGMADIVEFDLRGSQSNGQGLEGVLKDVSTSIDIEKGPLTKLALLRTDQGDLLYFYVHHLVMDGISWRILLEDFILLYQSDPGTASLPAKSNSFKTWSESLEQYANSRDFLKELPYWSELTERQYPKLPVDPAPETGGMATVEVAFSEETTSDLLTKSNVAYNTETTDLLLAALGLALEEATGSPNFLIELEAHGREGFTRELDVSRTIGWFTSSFPVHLQTGAEGDLKVILPTVKEMLRRIPGRGIGYSLLKYLTRSENKAGFKANAESEILFNYLGQFEQKENPSGFSISKGLETTENAPDRIQNYKLVIFGQVRDGQLRFTFAYNKDVLGDTAANALGQGFEKALCRIVDHCLGKEEVELTPSDYGAGDLSMEELGDILDAFGE